jgi:hypothetical protein
MIVLAATPQAGEFARTVFFTKILFFSFFRKKNLRDFVCFALVLGLLLCVIGFGFGL